MHQKVFWIVSSKKFQRIKNPLKVQRVHLHIKKRQMLQLQLQEKVRGLSVVPLHQHQQGLKWQKNMPLR